MYIKIIDKKKFNMARQVLKQVFQQWKKYNFYLGEKRT